MEHSKLGRYLEIATNVAVLIVAVVVLATFAWNYYLARQLGAQLQPGLYKQATLTPLPGITYGDSSQTLLIAMNTRCDFCTASVPFYNQLLESSKDKTTRIVAIFPNSAAEVQQYVQQSKLNLDTVAEMDFNQLKLAGTPTVILIDPQGRILDFWVGKLSAHDEQEVMRTITRSA